MIGLVLVSHSRQLVVGLAEMIREMVGDSLYLQVEVAGGTEDGRLGTNSLAILASLQNCCQAEHIFVFCDLGSAILSAEMAVSLLSDIKAQQRVSILADTPLVEGAYISAVEASIGGGKVAILKALKLLKKEMNQENGES